MSSNEDNKNPLDFTLSREYSSADGEPIRSLLCRNSTEGEEDATELLCGSQSGVVSLFRLQNESNECVHSSPIEGSRPHACLSLLGIGNGTLTAVGSKDGHVRLLDISGACRTVLRGHSKTVNSLCSLLVEDEEYLVSGSWDGSAKIWSCSIGACVATLGDHENTVTVLSAGPGSLITASTGVAENGTVARHQLRSWRVSKTGSSSQLRCEALGSPLDNHRGPIRGLAQIDGMVLSCSNDSTVKLRSVETAECVETLATSPETPILLDVQALALKQHVIIAAAAEDGHLLVWTVEFNSDDTTNTNRAVQHYQRIAHPACVWKVLFLPNGDLVTAGQDSRVRVFTREPSRCATLPQIEALAQASQKTQGGPTPEEISKLPEWHLCALHSGTSEGQVRVFQKDNKAIAAQWNDSAKTWIELGQVMGTNPNQGTIDGKNYDHVLPIELDMPDGTLKKLQIGHNNHDNPFVTAQGFIDEHVLDQNYLAQIADYIRQRVGNSTTSVTLDNSNSVAPPPAKQVKLYNHLPMKGYLGFDVADPAKALPKVMNKIQEFHSQHQADTLDLTPLVTLQTTLTNTSRWHSSTVDRDVLVLLTRLLSQWPLESLFPVLDLTRMTALHPDACRHGKEWQAWSDLALSRCRQVTSLEDNKVAAVPMLTLRTMVNAIKSGGGARSAVMSRIDDVMTCNDTFLKMPGGNKNLRLTGCTLLLNVASGGLDNTSKALETIQYILSQKPFYEPEATNRALVALGTILVNTKPPPVNQKDVKAQLVALDKVSLNDKGRAVLEEIFSLVE